MTDQELDKECELLKRYIKYYVDCLAENALLKWRPDRGMSPGEIINLFYKTGYLVFTDKDTKHLETPVSFDLWKEAVQV